MSATITLGLPFADYRAIDAENASKIKVAHARSWAAYRHAEQHPDDGNTASRSKLRAYHALVLEGEEAFSEQFWTHDLHRASKEYKTLAPGMVALGKSDIKQAEADTARSIAAKLHSDPRTADYLTGDGASEVTIVWTDESTGIVCKARIDRVVRRGDTVIGLDLKNVGDVDERHVRNQILKLGWHIQGAHYAAALQAAYPDCDVEFKLICFEERDHHETAVWEMTQDGFLGIGERIRRQRLDELASNRASGTWPERYEGECEIDPPAYLLDEMTVDEDENDTIDMEATDVPY